MNPVLFDELKQKIALVEFELSRHATDQMALRQISLQEILDVVQRSEVIEDNPDD